MAAGSDFPAATLHRPTWNSICGTTLHRLTAVAQSSVSQPGTQGVPHGLTFLRGWHASSLRSVLALLCATAVRRLSLTRLCVTSSDSRSLHRCPHPDCTRDTRAIEAVQMRFA